MLANRRLAVLFLFLFASATTFGEPSRAAPELKDTSWVATDFAACTIHEIHFRDGDAVLVRSWDSSVVDWTMKDGHPVFDFHGVEAKLDGLFKSDTELDLIYEWTGTDATPHREPCAFKLEQ